jgi:hypothetical protein
MLPDGNSEDAQDLNQDDLQAGARVAGLVLRRSPAAGQAASRSDGVEIEAKPFSD